jgi:DNA-binding MarR family transcriptional regulator/GNAT superfamily N-acetyltransferase
MVTTKTEQLVERAHTVRSFNRFYTNVIGALREGFLGTRYSLTEARVIFELAQRHTTQVADLRRALDIDPGYLSRILSRFEADGLTARERSSEDGRRQVIRLTARGRRAFRTLDQRSTAEFVAMLSSFPDEQQQRLVGAMGTIRDILGDRRRSRAIVLRPPEAGDLGWVVHRHGILYAEEYGWDESFEGLVARIVSDFAEHRDHDRERAWIAEVERERVGCIFCTKRSEKTAQLRLLLVEQAARGMGVGSALVDECLRFAKQAGYERIMLWTNEVLRDARRLYERAGFRLVEEEKHHSFGQDLVGQNWERLL